MRKAEREEEVRAEEEQLQEAIRLSMEPFGKNHVLFILYTFYLIP